VDAGNRLKGAPLALKKKKKGSQVNNVGRVKKNRIGRVQNEYPAPGIDSRKEGYFVLAGTKKGRGR